MSEDRPTLDVDPRLMRVALGATALWCGCSGQGSGLVYISNLLLDGGITVGRVSSIPAAPPITVVDAGTCGPAGATQPCYTGPAGTAGANGCHGGTSQCLPEGYWGPCEGEVNPAPGLTDVVFILDNTDFSCADGMGIPEFVQAQEAALGFMLANPQSVFRYAILTVPGCSGCWPGFTDAGYSLYQPLTDSEQAVSAIGVQCVTSTDNDPSCGVAEDPYAILGGQLRGELVPWDDGAQKVVVFFTAASGAVAPPPSAAADVAALLFVEPAYAANYEGQGQVFSLSSAPAMLQALQSAMAGVYTCGG